MNILIVKTCTLQVCVEVFQRGSFVEKHSYILDSFGLSDNTMDNLQRVKSLVKANIDERPETNGNTSFIVTNIINLTQVFS